MRLYSLPVQEFTFLEMNTSDIECRALFKKTLRIWNDLHSSHCLFICLFICIFIHSFIYLFIRLSISFLVSIRFAL